MVSVIITTYQRPKLLKEAISSVIKQTYEKFECIVVDDGSEISAKPVVEGFDDPRVKYFRHEVNRGLSAARNTAIKLSRMPFIAFLDDDDQWLPGKLERQVEYLSKAPTSVGLVYCWMQRVRNETVDGIIKSTKEGNIFEHALKRQPIPNASAWLVRKDAIDSVGNFDEELQRGIDGDFLRRLCSRYEVEYIPQVLGKYHLEHGFERITSHDEKGIRKAIVGQKTKLKKFGTELKKRPHIRAYIYGNIAYRYAQLGEWHECFKAFCKALRSDLSNARVYLEVLKPIYKFVNQKLST